jgi:hypothetical protein
VKDVNLSTRQMIEILQHLRQAQAAVVRDMEEFHPATLTLGVASRS